MPTLDDYDYEDESGSDSAISSLESQLISSGTALASQALQNSSIAAQPGYFQTIPTSPSPVSSISGTMLLLIVLVVGFIAWEIF